MASLRGLNPEGVGKPRARRRFKPLRGGVPKGSIVTAVRLETGRSRLGQAEARGNPGGGPNRGSDVQFVPLTPV